MSEIASTKLSDIDPNPMRQLSLYPYNAEALGSVKLREDVETVERVHFECGEAAKRFDNWQSQLDPRKRVVPLKQIEGRS
jgi:hypothetical protein